ncbi:MAG: hypothetical protein K1X89_29880 [Myxococcaceae bacterium]|nr:hypothetical protein [Myxococcaceae bacterium]
MKVTEQEFAELVMHALRARGQKGPLLFDARENVVRLRTALDGTVAPRAIALSGGCAEYEAADPSQRKAVVARYAGETPGPASTQLTVPPPPPPPTYDEEKRALRLRLVARRTLEKAFHAQHSRSAGNALEDFRTLGGLLEPLVRDVFLEVVRQGPRGWSSVTAAEAAGWTLEPPQALALARENLAKVSAEPWVKVESGLFRSPWSDGLAAARLALPDRFRALSLRGAPLVVAPHQGCVLVTGTEEREAHAAFVALALEEARGPGPLLLSPLQLTKQGWQRVRREDEALVEASPDLLGLAREDVACDYLTLQDEVSFALRRRGYGLVGSIQRLDGELAPLFSLCPEETDSASGRTAFPEAEMVMFPFAKGVPLVVPLERLAALVGPSLSALDVWPKFYELKRRPTIAQLEALV